MRSNYKKLGDFIRQVNNRNIALSVSTLLGVSIQKCFMPSIANTIGTDMSTYKIIKNKQFAYGPVTSRNGDKISIALLEKEEEAILSQAYTVFEVVDHNVLDPEYLMMWFRRPEFDRYARFKSHGSAREVFDWVELCETELPIPSIEKQREIVREYNTIVNRISLNEQLIQKLEETAQAIYKRWFVDFEFPNEEGKPYKSSGGTLVWNEELDKEIPEGWEVVHLDALVDFSNGYAFKSDQLHDIPADNCYDVFKMGNIKRGGGFLKNGTRSWVLKEDVLGLERFILKAGDILMAMTDMKESIGLLGNTALMTVDDKFILNQRVGRLRVQNRVGIGPFTLFILTNSRSFLEQIRLTANYGVQVNLTSEGIRESKIPIAPNVLNENFEKILESILNYFNLQINAVEKYKEFEAVLLSKMTKVEETTEKEMR